MSGGTEDRDDREDVEGALQRELYWAQGSDAEAREGAAAVRDRLRDLGIRLRADERLLIPPGEGNLASPSRWRRALKYRLWRFLRPVTRRYDRLIAEHAELTASLADRVMFLEVEVGRLLAPHPDASSADTGRDRPPSAAPEPRTEDGDPLS